MSLKITGFVSSLIFIALFATSTTSCYKYNEEELYSSGCDTTEVLYSVHIQPLVQNFCYACHGSTVFSSLGDNLELEGYSNFLVPVNSGALMGAISHEANFSPMPQNSPKLSECSINTIQAWINQGALNN